MLQLPIEIHISVLDFNGGGCRGGGPGGQDSLWVDLLIQSNGKECYMSIPSLDISVFYDPPPPHPLLKSHIYLEFTCGFHIFDESDLRQKSMCENC